MALERLSRMEDGRLAYRMKRPLPDGTTRLFFTGLELLRRLASLVPPPRANLTRFHGVFAPGAKVRPFLLSQSEAEPGPEEESPALAATVESTKERTPRLDWAGLLRLTFALDVPDGPTRLGVRVLLELSISCTRWWSASDGSSASGGRSRQVT
uniref:transposase n=1 Tax=Archangium gephyra TaxID=48 RepID=UPI00406A4A8F